jgi:undecaprenyl-diphosphatase
MAGRPARRPVAPRPARPLRREIASAARRLWLPAVLITTGMVLLGLLLSHVLAHGWVGTEDATIDRELASSRTPTGNSVTAVLTALASTPVVIGITAAAAVAFRVAFGRWRESVYLVLCTAGETTIFLLTTLAVHRSRPTVRHLDVAPPTSSFPSGHTAAALCCYGAIAAVLLWRYRQPALRAAAVTVAALLPLLVGASRLYRGMHFPTDVLAGLLLGTSWLAATTRWFHRSR